MPFPAGPRPALPASRAVAPCSRREQAFEQAQAVGHAGGAGQGEADGLGHGRFRRRRFSQQFSRDQAVDGAENQRCTGEDRGEQEDAVVRDQPGAGEQQLATDVGEGGEDGQADRAEPARRQMLRGAEGEQAERGAGQRQEEAGGEEVAEQQAAGQHAQTADPDGSAPAVAGQHDEGDDVGQPGLDAGQRRRNGRIDQRQADRRGGQPGDAAVFGGDGEFNN
jgi:hypothetical protein